MTDLHLASVPAQVQLEGRNVQGYLHTSPEFAMKRMLASGSGPIYQICKAFRGGESGPTHNPEFTMLEWYDTRVDYPAARKQLGELVCTALGADGFDEFGYRELFSRFAEIDPFGTDDHSLRKCLQSKSDFHSSGKSDSTDDLLNIILSEVIQPKLGADRPVIVFDWPESQAALARTRVHGELVVAERFEIYCCGIELANGYCELLDPDQLVKRAAQNNSVRKENGKSQFPESSRLVDAMRAGMPECCGVALGVDRLLMLQLRAPSISDVIPFPIERA